MAMALIAPELIVAWAIRQWISARRVIAQFKDSGYFAVPHQQERSETLWQCLAKPFKKLVQDYVSEQSEDYTWTDTHSFFLLMGGFMLFVDGEPYRTLQPDQLLKLIDAGCIDPPTLTAKKICDKSKGNAISTGLIILQVAWFVLQLIYRAVYDLHTTLLETGTLAFAVLDFITHAVWWDKPLDVQCPHPVYWKLTESKPEDYIEEYVRKSITSTVTDYVCLSVPEPVQLTEFWILASVARPIVEVMGGLRIPTSRKLRVPTFDGSIKLEDSERTALLFAGYLTAIIFGGVHCMAWYFAFPTYQEQLLWHTSVVIITCVPLLQTILVIPSMLLRVVRPRVMPRPKAVVRGMPFFIVQWIRMLFVTFYVASRFILWSLMFTTLRDLPSDTYETVSWVSLVPHL